MKLTKQKPNRITSAETAADSDKMPKLTTSSHHIAKPPVGCCYFSSSSKLSSSGDAETHEMKSTVPRFFQTRVAKIIPTSKPKVATAIPKISPVVVG